MIQLRSTLQLLHGDCVIKMKGFASNCIDLTVTSPPYDNLRKYTGFVFDFYNAARELYRITKPGGVVVWVVADGTTKGSETGTSFKQALYFKECGFNLHDTMIWVKDGGGAIGSKYCYTQNTEYMFVLSKGRPKTVNLLTKPNGSFGKVKHPSGRRNTDGTRKVAVRKAGAEHSKRNNWWYIPPSNSKDHGHPACFPLQIPSDHIRSWSNIGDLVFDPLVGSGTTGIAAKKLGRNFIGIDISNDYIQLAKQRILELR